MPHAPQFAGSVATLTQEVPHRVVPPAQLTPHLPAEQTWPLGHAMSHAPQFAGSAPTLTQEVPQSVVPPAQLTLHVPDKQA